MPSKRSKSRCSRKRYPKRRSASRKSYKRSYSRRRSPRRKSASRKRSGSRRKIGYVKVSAANPCSMLTNVGSCGGNPNCNWTKRGCVRRSGYAKGSSVYEGPMLPPTMPALLSSAPTTCYRF